MDSKEIVLMFICPLMLFMWGCGGRNVEPYKEEIYIDREGQLLDREIEELNRELDRSRELEF
jgi:hypothetical protein